MRGRADKVQSFGTKKTANVARTSCSVLPMKRKTGSTDGMKD